MGTIARNVRAAIAGCVMAGPLLLGGAPGAARAAEIDAAGIAVEIPAPAGFAAIPEDAAFFTATDAEHQGYIAAAFFPAGFSGDREAVAETRLYVQTLPPDMLAVTEAEFAERVAFHKAQADRRDGQPYRDYAAYDYVYRADDGDSLATIAVGTFAPGGDGAARAPEVAAVAWVHVNGTVLTLFMVSTDLAASGAAVDKGWALFRGWARAIVAANGRG